MLKKTHSEAKRRIARVGATLTVIGAIATAVACSQTLLSCVSLARIDKEPVVRMESLAIASPDAQGATLIFGLEVDNPNSVALEVDAVDYQLEIEGVPFAAGALEKPASVPAKGKAIVQVPVRLRYQDAFRSILDFIQTGSRKYRIKGSAKFGFFRIPFDKSGEVNFRP